MFDITKKCYKKSVELLKSNATKFGVAASSLSDEAKKKGYTNIFGRDASICALGMVASRDKKLIALAGKSLLSLGKYQSKYGQIPYSVDVGAGQGQYYYLGDIDSTLWWLVALDFYDRYAPDKGLKARFEREAKKAIRWLWCQSTNNSGLLIEPEAGGWADYMPVNGAVLYTNTLWLKVLSIYGKPKEYEQSRRAYSAMFLPRSVNPARDPYLKQATWLAHKWFTATRESVEDTPYYLHYVSFRHAGGHCDIYGNSLAVLFGIAPRLRAESIIRYIRNIKASKKYPVMALWPPIQRKENEYRDYLDDEHSLNQPYGYHNGGIWPYIGSFYVMALKKAGQDKLAAQELKRVAEANKVNNWEFNEWFHGKKGKPMGMPGQSWNAGTYILAHHYLNGDIEI